MQITQKSAVDVILSNILNDDGKLTGSYRDMLDVKTMAYF